MVDQDEMLQVFRHHRHDVMNGLQVIRGYIQLNRIEAAIGAVDRLADWLTSLSKIHSVESANYAWLLAASRSPHVLLTDVVALKALSFDDDERLASVWTWLDEQVVLNNMKWVKVRTYGNRQAGSTVVQIVVERTKEIELWWDQHAGEMAWHPEHRDLVVLSD